MSCLLKLRRVLVVYRLRKLSTILFIGSFQGVFEISGKEGGFTILNICAIVNLIDFNYLIKFYKMDTLFTIIANVIKKERVKLRLLKAT